MNQWLTAWRALPGAQRIGIGLLAALLLIVQFDQPYPDTAVLHHVPTAVLILAAPLLLRRWPLATGELACILLFLGLHPTFSK